MATSWRAALRAPLAVLLLVASPAALLAQGTPVFPTLVPPSPWTLAGSPYRLMGDVSLAGLQIQPGVQILATGNYSVTLTGNVAAVGTAAAPIRFGVDPANSSGWKGIRMTSARSDVQLAYCEIRDARERAIALVDSAPQITDCSFGDNRATGNGGAVEVANSTVDLVLERCEFIANRAAWHGGAIHADMSGSARLVLRWCRFVGNLANPDQASRSCVGGALRALGPAVVEDCEFRGNASYSLCRDWYCDVTGRGGAIYADRGDLRVVRSVFQNNLVFASEGGSAGGSSEHAWSRGGAIYYSAVGTLEVGNSVFVGNRSESTSTNAYSYGAGIYVASGIANVINATMTRNVNRTWTNNTTSWSGGIALYCEGGAALSVRNSIVCEDKWEMNGAWRSTTQIAGATTIEYSCIEGGATGIGNIATNPQFVGLGSRCGDVSITATSPCVDAGDPAAAYDDCTPPGLGTARNDIGAFGGPGACGWVPAPQLALHVAPSVAHMGSRCVFELSGAFPRMPAAVIATHVYGTPIPPLLIDVGIAAANGRWTLDLGIPVSPNPLDLALLGVALDPSWLVAVSNPADLSIVP